MAKTVVLIEKGLVAGVMTADNGSPTEVEIIDRDSGNVEVYDENSIRWCSKTYHQWTNNITERISA